MLRWLYKLDHLYGLLLTFGLALIIEGLFRQAYGVSGMPYSTPDLLRGATDIGFMTLPNYRAWVVMASVTVCLATWYVIERTKLGAYLRAGTENPKLVQAFGVNVPLMITLTYGFGVALAGLAGVLASPIIQINPLMGSNLIIAVFAVVVIGGMGSIMGAIVTGLGLGVIEGLTRGVLSRDLRHRGVHHHGHRPAGAAGGTVRSREIAGPPVNRTRITFIVLIALGLAGPLLKDIVYPVFLMNVLCFALFAPPSTCCSASPVCSRSATPRISASRRT